MARLRYRREAEAEVAAREFHHNVYVILLDATVVRHSTILRVNPKRDPAKPCDYIGMSGLAPEEGGPLIAQKSVTPDRSTRSVPFGEVFESQWERRCRMTSQCG